MAKSRMDLLAFVGKLLEEHDGDVLRDGVQVQAVAEALEIHPFMLSKWRKEAREGVLRGRVAVPGAVKTALARDL